MWSLVMASFIYHDIFRFIHIILSKVIAGISISFLFLAKQYSNVWTYHIYFLFINWWTLRLFYFGAIMNNTGFLNLLCRLFPFNVRFESSTDFYHIFNIVVFLSICFFMMSALTVFSMHILKISVSNFLLEWFFISVLFRKLFQICLDSTDAELCFNSHIFSDLLFLIFLII